jgi:C-terminal processing protease CtpA/Prc
VKEDELIESAIKGMTDGLWDKHSEYLTKKEAKSFHEALSW